MSFRLIKGGLDFSQIPPSARESLRLHLGQLIQRVECAMYNSELHGCTEIQFLLSDILTSAEKIFEAIGETPSHVL